MTKGQQAALQKWASIAAEFNAIEEFLDWAGAEGKANVRFSVSRKDLLNEFFGINERDLEDARQSLLREAKDLGL